MGSIDDISQLCRLCLVKDQVNIPIFDGTSDIGQTFIKIESCLPVKVSRNDNLPKKICDGCSYKLDMLYTFRNTSIDSEKQLIQWLNQAGLSTISQTTTVKDPLASTTKPEIMVKQENFDTTDSRVDGDNPDLVDPQSFMIQQDHLGYEQEFVDFGEASGSNANDDSLTDEPAPKRAKRAAALKKAPLDDETEDDLDAAMQITKAEEEDEEEVDQPEYVEAPSTSADDQPGPSGVGKATTEAPSLHLRDHDYCYQETFQCSRCPCKFKRRTDLASHISDLHERKYLYFCSQCDFATPRKNTMKSHQLRRHSTHYPHKCPLCKRAFASKKNLDAHVENIHNNAKSSDNTLYPCPICKKVFKSRHYVKKHEQSHNPDYVPQRDHVCDVCGATFLTSSNLTDHMLRHGSENKHVCETCGKGFKTKKDLGNHRITHTREKEVVCHLCGRKLISRFSLKIHMRVHNDEKPFKCIICGQAFRQSSTLNVHKYKHLGTPFKCEKCGKRFGRKILLKRHRCNGRNE